jgi:enterochelin esterase-like enzyme
MTPSTKRFHRIQVAVMAWMALVFATVTGGHAQDMAQGTVDHIKVPGPALEGNLLGIDTTRDVFVYLPPGYKDNPDRRYPVVYYLHGYSPTAEEWVNTMGWPERPDRAMNADDARDMIIVVPDAYITFRGSMYSTSVATGDWETYIVRDLVDYIDSHYRTLADRESRGLSGHSMGGYGTIRLAMKHPDRFSSIYAMSSCCLAPTMEAPPPFTKAESFETIEAVQKADRLTRIVFATAAAWSPNPNNPPFYLDLPTQDGESRPDVLARWTANAPQAMLPQYLPALESLDAIAMDVGTEDGLMAENGKFSDMLSEFGISHSYETYEGDHYSHIPERVETEVLPFFSKHLKFETPE